MRRVSNFSRTRSVLVTAFVAVLSVGIAAPAYAGMPAGGGSDSSESALPQIVQPPKKCAAAAVQTDWVSTDLVVATAIMLAESGCDPKATATNPPTADCPTGSHDRGAWQINDCYHPEVPDACAYDLTCSTGAAYTIWSKAGQSFNEWTVYKTRVFKNRLNEARVAVRKVTGENIVVGIITTTGGPLTVRYKPTTKSKAMGDLSNGVVFRVTCQTRGELVHSDVFDYDTRLWDKFGPHNWVTDAYVYTDASGRVAKRC